MIYHSHSAQETEEFGRQMAGSLKSGALLCLYGEIGAGKTTFVRGLARGLGIEQPIRSPTFSLVHEYEIREKGKQSEIEMPLHHLATSPPTTQRPTPNARRLFHMDLYRLGSPEQLETLNLEEYFGRGICVIEWAERASDLLPEERWEIHFQILEDEERQLTVIKRG